MIMQTTSVKTDFDPDALRSFLRQRFGEGELRLEVIGGGQSNPTYFVDYGERRLVLRKKRRACRRSRISCAGGLGADRRAGAASCPVP
jgi:aminoglycoside phosphotransferase (APT) family kinase protein